MGSSTSSERRGQASQGTVNLIFVCQYERVCAREAERNLRKLDLSREQAETVERISRS